MNIRWTRLSMKKSKTNTVEKSPTAIKKRILKAATKKFSKDGYQKTSLNDIVESAKASKGALLHHFHTKEELFFVVFSQSIDLEFQRIFEIIQRSDPQIFQKRKNLFEDLKKYYDLIVAGSKEFERLWLEGAIESANNPKLRQMMIKKDNDVAMVAVEMLKGGRSQIGILEGYSDAELLEVARGVSALWRGIFLDKMTGKDPKEMKNMFARMLYNVYSSRK